MIQLKLQAEAVCDEPNCTETQQVKLVLMGLGNFAFVPHQGEAFRKWQVVLPNQNPAAPFITRCAEHAKQVQSASVIPDLAAARAKAH